MIEISVKKKFNKFFMKKPSWLMNTPNHKKFWTDCISCNKIIEMLIRDIILEDESIDYLIEKFDTIITRNLDLLTTKEQHLAASYYKFVLEACIAESESYEMYESCHNLKKFYDFFYKK
jgi:hypothetical protein